MLPASMTMVPTGSARHENFSTVNLKSVLWFRVPKSFNKRIHAANLIIPYPALSTFGPPIISTRASRMSS